MEQNWFKLDDFSEIEVPHAPSELWILNLLEIPLIYGKDIFLPIVLCHYIVDGLGRAKGALWSQPYSALKVPVGPFTPKRREQILKALYEHEAACEVKLQDSIDYALYYLGVTDCRQTIRRRFVEYKRSPRTPALWKAYLLRYISITHLDRHSIINLVDPDGLRGVHLLPMGKYKDTSSVTVRQKAEEKNPLFMGIPLSTNLALCYEDGSLSAFRFNANKLTQDECGYSRPGGIFCVDTSGFGAFCEYVKSNHSTLTQNGEKVFGEFLAKLQDIFNSTLRGSGFGHWRLEGDGFVAAISTDSALQSEEEARNAFTSRCIEVISLLLNKIDSVTQLSALRLSLRASIHFGEYFFGKTIGETLSGPHLLGPDLITAVRLRDAAGYGPADLGSSPCVITILPEFAPFLRQNLMTHNRHSVEHTFGAVVKEFRRDVVSFTF